MKSDDETSQQLSETCTWAKQLKALATENLVMNSKDMIFYADERGSFQMIPARDTKYCLI